MDGLEERVMKLRALATELNFRLVVIEDGVYATTYAPIEITKPTKIYGVEVVNGHLPLGLIAEMVERREAGD